MQRVAKNLRLRGGSYEFRKWIPPEARPLFGGIKEYVRSFGDVTPKEAEGLATFHRAYCHGLISDARGKSKRKRNVVELIRVKRVPEREEIERAVRDWLLDREAGLGTSLFAGGGEDKARDLRYMRDEVIRRGSRRSGVAIVAVLEIVDFILRSVNELLQTEFGQTLGSEGVHILDPFTGTGTFITRLIQSGLITPTDLARKYAGEIHANEIVLLASRRASRTAVGPRRPGSRESMN